MCQTLADEFRSFCNFQFMFPLRLLGFIAEKIGVRVAPDGYDRQVLTWRIEVELRELSRENFQELRSYLSGENGRLKRFQLARKLANIFDQYQVMRPEMLAGWMEGRSATEHPAEKWQMELWLRLAATPEAGEHRGLLFRQVIELLASGQKFQHLLPKRISVLGLHIMPPVFLEFLNNLAKHCDVHLFVLSPCKHYWGDVETRKTEFKRTLQLPLQQEEIAESRDRENHPLLAGLGQQGRDFQKMMLENIDFEVEFESFEDPFKAADEPTLLHLLQSDLLHGEVVQREDILFPGSDRSIQIVSCHSIFREITILKDHLLQLLYEDHTLQLRDIIVMAPDIQEYAPLIPAVFDDIQYSIADNSLKMQNRYISVFLSFLDLFKGRFGWNEIMELLRQPVIFPHFGLASADLDCLQQWVLGTSIRWGLSKEQRDEMGVASFSEATWSAGIERLLMGYAIDAEGFVDGVLPFSDIEGSGAGMVGGLCQFISIIERTRTLFRSEHSLDTWSLILLDVTAEIFGENDQKEYVELRNILSEPAEDYSTFCREKVGFDVILEWMKIVVRESRSSTGFLRGKLTFCSMLPMRSVPFRVVCLLGLNDGVFPKNDIKPTFDLMDMELRLGDRSPRADDRYQFLEATLAARSNLYLSYIGQSVRTNEAIPPSVVVTEFLEFLVGAYGVESPVVIHPLHQFNKGYFVDEKESGLFSYNRYYCTTAKNLQKEMPLPGPWLQGELEGEIELISFNELLSFYRNPQSWFVRNCLGVSLENEAELPEERETFKTEGLDMYMVDQEIVTTLLGGEASDIMAELEAEGRWPLGSPGSLRYQEKVSELISFTTLVRSQDMGGRVADEAFTLKVGLYTLSGTLSNLYENGVMLFRYANLKGKDLLINWLHHLVANSLFGKTRSALVAADTVLNFSSDGSVPGLELMLDHFVKGCRRPSQFFVEPAFRYCDQLRKRNSRVSPLDKAITTLNYSLEKGYEPAWNLLLQGRGEEPVLGSEFESLCLEIMNPIWNVANGK